MKQMFVQDDDWKTIRDCVCSDCWGPLHETTDPDTGEKKITCSTPGCPCNGYRSKKGVERAESDARGQAAELKVTLRQAGYLPKKNESQLMAELGF